MHLKREDIKLHTLIKYDRHEDMKEKVEDITQNYELRKKAFENAKSKSTLYNDKHKTTPVESKVTQFEKHLNHKHPKV